MSELLNQERLVQDGRIVPREFPLKHARAEQIIDVLYVMVGLDPKSRPSQMDLQLQQQKLQLMTQMQQQGKDVSTMLKQDGPPVYLAYNRQRNSVMANAPPEYMKIIERSIRYLDVPPQGAEGAAGPLAEAPGDRQPRVQEISSRNARSRAIRDDARRNRRPRSLDRAPRRPQEQEPLRARERGRSGQDRAARSNNSTARAASSTCSGCDASPPTWPPSRSRS